MPRPKGAPNKRPRKPAAKRQTENEASPYIAPDYYEDELRKYALSQGIHINEGKDVSFDTIVRESAAIYAFIKKQNYPTLDVSSFSPLPLPPEPKIDIPGYSESLPGTLDLQSQVFGPSQGIHRSKFEETREL